MISYILQVWKSVHSLIQLDGVDNKESFLGSWLWLAQWSEVWASGRYDYLALYYEGSHIIIKHKPFVIALHSRIKSFPPKIPSSMYENQDSRLEPSLHLYCYDGWTPSFPFRQELRGCCKMLTMGCSQWQ